MDFLFEASTFHQNIRFYRVYEKGVNHYYAENIGNEHSFDFFINEDGWFSAGGMLDREAEELGQMIEGRRLVLNLDLID